MLKSLVLMLVWLVSVIPNGALTETPTYPIAWSADGEIIASSGTDGKIDLWRSNGQRLLSIETGDTSVTALAWSPDSQFLASVGDELRIWDMKTARQSHALRLARTLDLTLSWSPDGTQLAALAADGSASIWSTADWSLVATLTNADPRYVRWQDEQFAPTRPSHYPGD